MSDGQECWSCGRDLAGGARYCCWCGSSLAAGAPAARAELLGLPVTVALLAVAALELVLALVLFVSGHWLLGLLVILAAGAFVVAFAALAAQTVERRFAAARDRVLRKVRARAGFVAEAVAARVDARKRVFLLDREVDELNEARREHLLSLGAAVYACDAEASERERSAVGALDLRIATKRAERERVVREAEERIARARDEAAPTQIVTSPSLERRDG